jgi:hypothetical protein
MRARLVGVAGVAVPAVPAVLAVGSGVAGPPPGSNRALGLNPTEEPSFTHTPGAPSTMMASHAVTFTRNGSTTTSQAEGWSTTANVPPHTSVQATPPQDRATSRALASDWVDAVG